MPLFAQGVLIVLFLCIPVVQVIQYEENTWRELARQTVLDFPIIASFAISLCAFVLSVSEEHHLAEQNKNKAKPRSRSNSSAGKFLRGILKASERERRKAGKREEALMKTASQRLSFAEIADQRTFNYNDPPVVVGKQQYQQPKNENENENGNGTALLTTTTTTKVAAGASPALNQILLNQFPERKDIKSLQDFTPRHSFEDFSLSPTSTSSSLSPSSSPSLSPCLSPAPSPSSASHTHQLTYPEFDYHNRLLPSSNLSYKNLDSAAECPPDDISEVGSEVNDLSEGNDDMFDMTPVTVWRYQRVVKGPSPSGFTSKDCEISSFTDFQSYWGLVSLVPDLLSPGSIIRFLKKDAYEITIPGFWKLSFDPSLSSLVGSFWSDMLLAILGIEETADSKFLEYLLGVEVRFDETETYLAIPFSQDPNLISEEEGAQVLRRLFSLDNCVRISYAKY